MKVTERRQLARLNLRTPLRFRALGVASDRTEHFTEALNVSRGGCFFAASAPPLAGIPLDTSPRISPRRTGNCRHEMLCNPRGVHVRHQAYGDGRIRLE